MFAMKSVVGFTIWLARLVIDPQSKSIPMLPVLRDISSFTIMNKSGYWNTLTHTLTYRPLLLLPSVCLATLPSRLFHPQKACLSTVTLRIATQILLLPNVPCLKF